MIIVHYCPFDVNSNVTVVQDGRYLHESIPSNTEDFPEAVYRLTQSHKDNEVKIYGPKDIMEETSLYIKNKYNSQDIKIEVIEA